MSIALVVALGIVASAGAQVTGCDPNVPSSNRVYRVSGTAANSYVSIPLPASPAYFNPDIATGLPLSTNSLAIDPNNLSRVYYIRGSGVDVGKAKYWDLASQTEVDPGLTPTALPAGARDTLAAAKNGALYSYSDATGIVYNISAGTNVTSLPLVNIVGAPSGVLSDYKVNDVLVDGWGVMWMVGLFPKTSSTGAHLLRVNTVTGRASYEGALAFQDSAGAPVAFPALTSSSGIALSPTSTNATPVFVWTSASQGTWTVDVLGKIARKTGPNTAAGADLASCVYTEVTVPVSFAAIDVKRQNGWLEVAFTSAQEAGVLGYRVIARDPGGDAEPLLPVFTPARGAGQSYLIRGADLRAAEVFIEELDSLGGLTAHGPFAVGKAIGAAKPQASYAWQAAQLEQAAFTTLSRADRSPGFDQRGVAADVVVRVAQSGWVHLSAAELAAAGFASNLGIGVFAGASEQPVLRHQGGISFYGKAIDDSIYTRTRSYRLGASKQADLAAKTHILTGDSATESKSIASTNARGELVIAPNREYSFSAPNADPFYAGTASRMTQNSTPHFERFDLPALITANETVRLSLHYWGALDLPALEDHALAFYLNGQLIAQDAFDGFLERRIRVSLPAAQFKALGNVLEMRALSGAQTGAFDRVNLESLTLDYPRSLMFAGDELRFRRPTAGRFTIQSAPSDATLWQVLGDGSHRFVSQKTDKGGLELDASPGDEYLVVADSTARPHAALGMLPKAIDPFASLAPAQAPDQALDQLIIVHPSLQNEIEPLLALHRAKGLKVYALNVQQLYGFYSADVVHPSAIQAAISDAAQRFGLKSVLLIGGDTTEAIGNPAGALIPTLYVPVHQAVRYAPFDAKYGDINGDGMLQAGVDIPVGRLPAQTSAELRVMLQKRVAAQTPGTQTPGTQTPGTQVAAALANITVADREQAGFSFADAALGLDQYFAPGFSTRLALDDFNSPTSLRHALSAQVAAGARLIQYLGHSAPMQWSREAILSSSDVRAGLFASSANSSSVLLQWGCWGGYFVDANADSLARALMSTPGGVRAVLAPAALSDVGRDLRASSAVLLGSKTLGSMLMRLNSADASGTEKAAAFAPAFNLLGDPLDSL
jgi:hypothetical protein